MKNTETIEIYSFDRPSFFCVAHEITELGDLSDRAFSASSIISTLRQNGFNLIVLYTGHISISKKKADTIIDSLRSEGINIHILERMVPPDDYRNTRLISYYCYWYTRNLKYDAIIFMQCPAFTYYIGLSKKAGTHFLSTPIILIIDKEGSQDEHKYEQNPIANLSEWENLFLETASIKMADCIIYSTSYLKERYKTIRPESKLDSVAYPYFLKKTRSESYISSNTNKYTNIIIFCDHNRSSGIDLVLKAIPLLAHDDKYILFSIVGKFSEIDGEHSVAFIVDTLKNVPCRLDFKERMDAGDVKKVYRTHKVLCVVPFINGAPPAILASLLSNDLPFIVTDVCGSRELIDERDFERVLFEPHVEHLISAIHRASDREARKIRPSKFVDDAEKRFLDALSSAHTRSAPAIYPLGSPSAGHEPLVSVVITHRNRPQYLESLLDILQRQSYKNFEVVLVDDGSDNPEAINYINSIDKLKFSYELRIIVTENVYLGAARNLGALVAKGEYIKFQDDDNIPNVLEIETFVTAAASTDADIVTAVARYFREPADLLKEESIFDLIYIPLGTGMPFALFKNEYGDANCLVRRETFIADGGFSELRGVGYEDHEFFVKSEMKGRKFAFIPEPIFNYRLDPKGMLNTTSIYRGRMRVRSAALATVGNWASTIVDMVHDENMARELKLQARWRAGKRPCSNFHLALLDVEPGKGEATELMQGLIEAYRKADFKIQVNFLRDYL